MTKEELIQGREQWLKERAAEMRLKEKPDCTKLMDWIDENSWRCNVKYKYRPIIRADEEKYLIPDLLLEIPRRDFEMGSKYVVIEFINTHSPYFSKDKIHEREKTLTKDGWCYYYAYKSGLLSGNNPDDPETIIKEILEEENFIYAKYALKYDGDDSIIDECLENYDNSY